MKDLTTQLQENAVELLTFVKQSKDFMVEQAPMYVQELVEFHFFENMISTITGVVVLATILLLVILIQKNIINKLEEQFDKNMTYLVLSICLGIPFLAVIGDITKHTKECYKAKYAPRVLIIEKLSEIVK